MAGKLVPYQDRVKRLRGRAGVKQRQRRLKRSYGLCEHCLASGITKPAVVVNHKVPLAFGGSDLDENTENLCRACDERVTAEQFGRLDPTQRGVDIDGRPALASHPWNKGRGGGPNSGRRTADTTVPPPCALRAFSK